MQHRCPFCGRCPTCGQPYPSPWPNVGPYPYPYTIPPWPWYTQPFWYNTDGGVINGPQLTDLQPSYTIC